MQFNQLSTIKVSVIIPVYNAEDYILNSLNSILQQTHKSLEIWVIDDASTDKTIENIQSLSDDRIKLIKKTKNSGYTDSLNYGLEVATGKYIARMDADDISYPERIAKQVAYMESQPDCVVCGSWITLVPGGKLLTYPVTHEDIVAQLLRVNAMCHPSVMIRKSVIDQHELRYNREYEPAEDYDMWSRMAFLGKLHNIPEPLLQYRLHDNQISTTKYEIQRAHMRAVRLKLLQLHHPTSNSEVYNTMPILTGMSVTNWLKNKYAALDELNKLQGKLPVAVIQNFVQYQKKEVIRNITRRENKYTLKVWMSILVRCPEAFINLGLKHTITFLIRSLHFVIFK
jgi:glycosyltransferase involved in cell wall biosynthesis